MDKMIARLNISHYKMKLVTEQDEAKRQILLRLLAEEEAKLAALDDPPKRKGARISLGPAILASGSDTRRSCAWFPP